MRLSVITSSSLEPLTLQEAKDHLRVSFTKDDDLITSQVVSARQAFERDTGRQLLTATFKGFLDGFPRFKNESIKIGRPPLLSVAAVNYVDTSGVLVVWTASEYTFEALKGPNADRGEVFPKPDVQYPFTRRVRNAVTIDFDAGYGATAADVPAEIKEALLGWIGHHYNNREAVIVPWPGFEPWRDVSFG